MSFSNNTNRDKVPGHITGNPLHGLCEKACIQVKKVFDACIRQEALEKVQICLYSTNPPNVCPPFTFVSAKSSSSTGCVKNLRIDKLDEKGCSRVRADVEIPLEVIFTDSNNITAKGKAKLTVPYDVVLRVPEPSIIPYQVEAVVNVIVVEGEYVGDCRFEISACVTVILKITTEVELLIPTYGYCHIPPCQVFTDNLCEEFFDLPLFP